MKAFKKKKNIELLFFKSLFALPLALHAICVCAPMHVCVKETD